MASGRLAGLPAPSPRAELLVLMLLAWAAFLALPWSVGGMRLSWDALNHHLYLGWIADSHRFDRDFLAAGYQSLAFPYLYWPVYKLAAAGASGITAGAVLATLHLVAVPPLWMIARVCIAGADWQAVAMRALALALAFLTGVVLSLFDATSNDLLAAAPLVWGIAFALQATVETDPRRARWLVVLSGFGAGMAVGCKLSNGPLAILLPLFWIYSATSLRRRVENVMLGGAATGLGLVAVYGYWGWQLWVRYGNPMYPFYDASFAPLRRLLGWHE